MKNLRTGFVDTITDDERIAYLKPRLDPEELLENLGIDISHHAGDWIMCHCPNSFAHSNGDSNPSFGFNGELFRYNCFTCGGGSLLQLVSDQLSISKDDAISWLQNQSTFEPIKGEDIALKLQKIIHPVVNSDVMPEYPDSAVDKFKFIHPYLLDRGISKETIIEMSIGYNEDHVGIVIPHWWMGKLRGWQIRHLVEINSRYYCPLCPETPKYINVSGFPKSKTLFGYDRAKEKKATEVVVVESPMSALYLMSNGYDSLATFGSWSMEQLSYLADFEKVLLWPDNDPAGSKNLQRVINPLMHLTNTSIVPVVNKVKGDAADVAPDELKNYLSEAYSPSILPLFDGKLPTLESLSSVTK